MKIEHQVCTFLSACILKELGVLQAGVLWYPKEGGTLSYNNDEYSKSRRMLDGCVSAFTVAELGVMLPDTVQSYAYFYDDDSQNWNAAVCNTTGDGGWNIADCVGDFKSEAEARAAMLIHLLERKTITVDEVNQRLISN